MTPQEGPTPSRFGARVANLSRTIDHETSNSRVTVKEAGDAASSYRAERQSLLAGIRALLEGLWTRLGLRPGGPGPRRRLPRVPRHRQGKGLRRLKTRHDKAIRQMTARLAVLPTSSWPARRLRLAIFFYKTWARYGTHILVAAGLVVLLLLLRRYPQLLDVFRLPRSETPP